MLDGWYCRSMANKEAKEPSNVQNNVDRNQHLPQGIDGYSSDSSSSGGHDIDYKVQYRKLKKKFFYLIYENECFQDSLRSSQKRLLRVSRDRSFLLDRLLEYEQPESSTSESEETESSDDGDYQRRDNVKRKKPENNQPQPGSSTPTSSNKQPVKRARKTMVTKKHPLHKLGESTSKATNALGLNMSNAGDGHMTPEEVERHLQSRQSYLEMLPERAPPTVPTEMFSNDPSLDSESNDVAENSPNMEWFD